MQTVIMAMRTIQESTNRPAITTTDRLGDRRFSVPVVGRLTTPSLRVRSSRLAIKISTSLTAVSTLNNSNTNHILKHSKTKVISSNQ